MSPRRPEHMKCANCMAFELNECRRGSPTRGPYGMPEWPKAFAESWCLAWIPDLPTQQLANSAVEGSA